MSSLGPNNAPSKEHITSALPFDPELDDFYKAEDAEFEAQQERVQASREVQMTDTPEATTASGGEVQGTDTQRRKQTMSR